MPRFRPILTAALVLICLTLPGATRLVSAQSQPVGPARLPQTLVAIDQQSAEQTRERLREVMRQYPPSLGRILKLDPSLMTSAAYLAPFPALAAFIQQHPEVPRNPAYYFNFVSDSGSYEPQDADRQMRAEALRSYRDMFGGVLVFLGFVTALLTLSWLIRYIVSHRRWLRSFKAQTELSTRLLERFHSSDDVLAYLRTNGGVQPFATAPVEAMAPTQAAPFNRILWSIQAGLVLMSGGAGLLVIRQYVMQEVGDMLLTFGVLAASLGIGFVLAAAASYILSRSLGLLDSTRDARHTGA